MNSLTEVFLVETLNPTDKVAFHAVEGSFNDKFKAFQEESSPFVDTIEQTLQLTGADNQAAKVCSELYELGIVKREYLAGLRSLIFEFDPPMDDIFDVLYKMEDRNQISAEERGRIYDQTYDAMSIVDWSTCILIDREGRISDLNDDLALRPSIYPFEVDDPPFDDMPLGELTQNIKNPHFMYTYELNWNREQPVIKSSAEHVCIGELAVSGEFMPMVTYLGRSA